MKLERGKWMGGVDNFLEVFGVLPYPAIFNCRIFYVECISDNCPVLGSLKLHGVYS